MINVTSKSGLHSDNTGVFVLCVIYLAISTPGDLLESICVSSIDGNRKLMFEIQNTFYEHLRMIFLNSKKGFSIAVVYYFATA